MAQCINSVLNHIDRIFCYEIWRSKFAMRTQDAGKTWEHHYASTQGCKLCAAPNPAGDPLPVLVPAAGWNSECRGGEGHPRSMDGWNPIVDSAVFPLNYASITASCRRWCVLDIIINHWPLRSTSIPPHCPSDYFSTASVSRPRCYTSYYRVESSHGRLDAARRPWSSPYKLGDGCGCCAGAGGDQLRECL